MSIVHELDSDSILRITYSGDLTLEEQLRFFDALVDQAVLRSPVRVLMDRRAVTSVAPAANARVAAEHLESWRNLFRDGRAAFVVSKPVEFGLVRMFEALSSGLHLESFVSYSVEEARTWLLAPDASSAA